jgi:hypothetical protein
MEHESALAGPWDRLWARACMPSRPHQALGAVLCGCRRFPACGHRPRTPSSPRGVAHAGMPVVGLVPGKRRHAHRAAQMCVRSCIGTELAPVAHLQRKVPLTVVHKQYHKAVKADSCHDSSHAWCLEQGRHRDIPRGLVVLSAACSHYHAPACTDVLHSMDWKQSRAL